MPLIDSNDPANWDGGPTSLYISGWTGGGYARVARQDFIGSDADILEAALRGIGLLKSHRLVFVGAAFGWITERFVELGYGPLADGTANGKLCAVDTSTWIQTNKTVGNNAIIPIINADVNAATGRRTIRQQFGSNTATIDWVLSEDVLPLLAGTIIGQNNEIVPFAQNLRTLATNVAHWIMTGVRRADDPLTWAGDARLNWKTLEDWKAWVTPDFVIGRGGTDNGRVL